MKAFILIIVSVVLTTIVINGYSSFTGTRAKSDDRSDTRTLRKQYDDLVLVKNDLDNTVKTQAKTIKDNKACQESLRATIAANTATINTMTVELAKSERARIATLTNYKRLKAKSIKSYTKKYTKKKTSKKYKKPAKSRNQIIVEGEIARLTRENRAELKNYLGYKKDLKILRGSIGGSPQSKKAKASKIATLLSKIGPSKEKYSKNKKKIAKLRSRSY